MNAVTTFKGKKPFTWSYSRLKNYEVCPKRHWHIDIAKDVQEEESEALTHGNQTHNLMARRIDRSVALPPGYEDYEKWAELVVTGKGSIKVEQKLAFREDFSPCGYWDRGVWFRGVIDVLKVYDDVALVLDWKTGKILEDSVQLALFAQCVFSHYHEVQHVRTTFVWLKDDAETIEDFARSDMPGLWNGLLPRIQELKSAHDNTSYPPSPGRLCAKWCPVISCPHNGERN